MSEVKQRKNKYKVLSGRQKRESSGRGWYEITVPHFIYKGLSKTQSINK
jgi:hypothetical protein